MKKILFILLIVVAGTLGGCKKYLEEKPFSFLSPANFPTNAQEADIALRGVYAIMQGREEYEGFDRRMFDYTLPGALSISNDLIDGSGYYTMNEGRGQRYTDPSFTAFYLGINSANTLIAALEGKEEPWVEAKVAEARAIRALYYFYLVRMFSDVPLKLTPTTSATEKYSRTPVPEIYNQIVEDLSFAEDKLPNRADPDGRITMGGCKGILTQVYISMAGFYRTPEGQNVSIANDAAKYFGLARDKAQEVLSLGVYTLASDYTQVFKDLTTDVYNNEVLFDIPFSWHGGGDVGAGFPLIYGPADETGGDGTRGGGKYGILPVLVEWVRELEPGDERVPWNIATYFYRTNTWDEVPYTDSSQWNLAKFRKWPYGVDGGGWMTFSTNFPVVRLSEIKLILAEAENELNGPTASAYQQVNDIRNRAGLASLPNGLTKDNLRDKIIAERAIELCGEAKRHFDLVRWGIFKQKMDSRKLSSWVLDHGGVDESYINTFIPQTEIDKNGWTQNK